MKELLSFFFPVYCPVCGQLLAGGGAVLCISCEFNMPRTAFARYADNPVSRLFWGRAPVQEGTALFRFEKGSPYQVLIHDMKYRGNRNAGLYLGRLLGRALQGTVYSGCEMLVPVPLHRKRLRERGYNQSTLIARGVSEITGIPLQEGILLRTRYHTSQTSRGRYDRYMNVRQDFRLSGDPPDLNGRKILLIDDVVTTGATLETCASVLHERYDCLLYTATVSYA
ncbi:MAG: ComF family protein [Bacteroidales bacterium]